VALFVDRARAVRHDFALTRDNAAAVVEICRRLEGLPLAIELAAARTRLLEPDALLRRLNRSLDALGTGAADLPERQHTLRATVEWSVGLLEDPERSLLETVAVFVDGWTVEAAARVAGLVEDRALEGTEDPFLHAVSELTIAGISAAVGDFEGALREALASLEELHRQDEAFWTAVAASTAGVEEMVEGRYDDALRHLTEVRDLGERFDSAGLTAGSRVQLGTLAIVRGRLDEARALLDEGLDLSLAAHTSRNVSLCLSAFALLVFVEGDPSGPRWWRGRPRACAGAPPWACGRCCGAGRPRWLPRSAWRWARTGSTRCSPPAPGSASGRRWPPSATVPPPRRRHASGFRRQSGGRG
jgi:tetratricopeptide (TPR) repeat protein